MSSMLSSVEKVHVSLVSPSEETPRGLYFLSNLDQTFPFLLQLVFPYKSPNNNDIVDTLRSSLSKALVHYYPLAGHLVRGWDGKMMVRCTGHGVVFVEATCDDELAVLGDVGVLCPDKLTKLVCCDEAPLGRDIAEIPCLALQVTRFKCGGLVLGVSYNHMVMDGLSLSNFMNSWAQIARGVPLSLPPFLDRSLLSPRQTLKVEYSHHEFSNTNPKISASYQDQMSSSRSFCFTRKKLNQLRFMATNINNNNPDNQFHGDPTNFELISAVLWTNWTKAFKIHPCKTSQLLIVVDSRRKFKTPLPEGYFGNGISCVCARSTAGDLAHKPLAFAVKRVRDAIVDVTEERVRSAIDYYEATRPQGYERVNTVAITKWSRLPHHEADFGWGQPLQVAPATLIDNFVVTLSRINSHDLIMSLSLPVSVMKVFEELMSQADITYLTC